MEPLVCRVEFKGQIGRARGPRTEHRINVIYFAHTIIISSAAGWCVVSALWRASKERTAMADTTLCAKIHPTILIDGAAHEPPRSFGVGA
jgi:hypothetical protein